MSKPHLIGRQRYRIQARRETEAHAVFEKLSGSVQDRVTDAIERVLAEFPDDGTVIRINQLRLQLEPLRLDDLEQDLLRQLPNALRRALDDLFPERPDNAARMRPNRAGSTLAAGEDRDWDTLRFFLQRGSYPWWQSRSRGEQPPDLLRRILAKDSPQHQQQLQVLLGQVQVRQRLAAQFSEGDIRALNQVLWREHWPSHQVYAAGLTSLLALRPASPPSPSASVSALVSLASVLPQGATHFSSLASVLLTRVAEIQGVEAPGFAEAILRADGAQTLGKSWRHALETLASSNGLLPHRQSPHPDRRDLAEALVRFLQSGVPLAAGELPAGKTTEQVLISFLREGHPLLLAALRRLVATPEVGLRWAGSLTPTAFTAIYRWWWGADWPGLQAYLQDLNSLATALAPVPGTLPISRVALVWWSAPRQGARPAMPDTAAITSLLHHLAKTRQQPAREIGRDLLAGREKNQRWASPLPGLLAQSAVAINTETAPFATGLPKPVLFHLRHFLERGYLPAEYATRGIERLEADLAPLLATGNGDWSDLLAELLDTPVAFTRLANSFSPGFLTTLLEALLMDHATASAIPQEKKRPDFPSGQDPGAAAGAGSLERARDAANAPVETFPTHLPSTATASEVAYPPSNQAPAQPAPDLFPAGHDAPENNAQAKEKPAADVTAPNPHPSGPDHASPQKETLDNTAPGYSGDSFDDPRKVAPGRTFAPPANRPAESGAPPPQKEVLRGPASGNPDAVEGDARRISPAANSDGPDGLAADANEQPGRTTAGDQMTPGGQSPPPDAVRDGWQAPQRMEEGHQESAPLPQSLEEQNTDLSDNGKTSGDRTDAPPGTSVGDLPVRGDYPAAGRSPAPSSEALHLRPRPIQTGATAEEPWAIFAQQLAKLCPQGWSRPPGEYARLGQTYAIRGLSRGERSRPLPAVLKGWGEVLATASGASWMQVADFFRHAAQDTTLPASVRTALHQTAILTSAPEAENVPASHPEVPEPPSEEAKADSPEATAIANWVGWLTDHRTGKLKPPSTTDFQLLIRSGQNEWLHFLTALRGKNIRFDKITRSLPAKVLSLFLTRLLSTALGGAALLYAALEALLVASQCYPSAAEAKLRCRDYAVTILLNRGGAVLTGQAFVGSLLASVARERRLGTRSLAQQLLATAERTEAPLTLRTALERIVAQLSEQEQTRLRSESERALTEAEKQDQGLRAGIYYRAALLHQLQTGEAAWWEEETLALEELFRHATRADAPELRRLLQEHQVLADRLFPFLSAAALQEVIHAVFTEYADLALAFTSSLEELVRGSAPTASATTPWRPVWDFLVGGQAFQSAAFVQSALSSAARWYRVDARRLAEALLSQVEASILLGDIRFFRLATLLRESGQDPAPPGATDEIVRSSIDPISPLGSGDKQAGELDNSTSTPNHGPEKAGSKRALDDTAATPDLGTLGRPNTKASSAGGSVPQSGAVPKEENAHAAPSKTDKVEVSDSTAPPTVENSHTNKNGDPTEGELTSRPLPGIITDGRSSSEGLSSAGEQFPAKGDASSPGTAPGSIIPTSDSRNEGALSAGQESSGPSPSLDAGYPGSPVSPVPPAERNSRTTRNGDPTEGELTSPPLPGVTTDRHSSSEGFSSAEEQSSKVGDASSPDTTPGSIIPTSDSRIEGALSAGQESSGPSPPAKDSQNTPAQTLAPPPPAPAYVDLLAADLAVVRHFLLYGTPGPTANDGFTQAGLCTIQEELLRRHPGLAQSLYLGVLADRTARERFQRFFPETLWREVLECLLEAKAARAERWWTELQTLLAAAGYRLAARPFSSLALGHLLGYVGRRGVHIDWTVYLTELLQLSALQTTTPLERLFVDLVDSLKQVPPGVTEDWAGALADVRQRQQKEAATKEKTNTKYDIDEPLNESIFIGNSGLVIIAPFLNRYFGTLDMLEGKAFKDEAAAVRGTLLLQYLVSGQTTVAEHELVLNKILCGLPTDTPVPNTLEMTEAEIELSRQLQNAVLQNWDKMSNSTVENLQGSFLLREGRLDESEDHWSLVVASKGFDILLSFLPWTISMISLPWMDKRLVVTWKSNFT
ncbi:contractile injection system tape measure protein [Neolewinella lacunae]|uniref:Uncharacterized protein n=1 Tax=Neolewinella lacunae TaxID=1517758 RepID=A0A923PM86_9BACT|nr:contractile injection system tape measure protein [Neolewinella lacunae]MBC6996662.1 hypothetical protein [Neolewinella lacunae]MDN3634773.1 contractile injection system tape measure protein [Neolewinella lacunae]